MVKTAQNFFLTFLVLSFTLIAGTAYIVNVGMGNKSIADSELTKVASNIEKEDGEIKVEEKIAYFSGKSLAIPDNIFAKDRPFKVLGVASAAEKWIEVDLSEQKLRAWDGNSLFLETLVSTGLPGTPTPKGEFRIWYKIRATKMEGGSGRYYYNLPNVPYVMFFENSSVPGFKGYGLHGTYWHNDFGTPHSHGCVNLPTEIAERLYGWTAPVVPAGKRVVRTSAPEEGTRIIIHD